MPFCIAAVEVIPVTTAEPATVVAAAWAPTAVELNAFAGRFFSEELEAYYTISVKDGVLIVENRRSSAVKMAPGAKDTFVIDATTLIFERDRNGQVIGFYAGNTRTRDVRFARVR
jgi:hypothetical protein